jgi:rod shape-determining protein MreD
MSSKYYLPIILFFPVLLIQGTVIPLIAVNGIIPDLILILLVFYSMNYGQLYGTVLGFIFGFLFDLITGSLLGSSMLSKTIAGFIAGYFSNENKRDIYFKAYSFSLIVLLCSTIDSVVNSFFTTAELNTNLFNLIFLQGMLPAVYSAVIGAFVILFYPKRSLS